MKHQLIQMRQQQTAVQKYKHTMQIQQRYNPLVVGKRQYMPKPMMRYQTVGSVLEEAKNESNPRTYNNAIL